MLRHLRKLVVSSGFKSLLKETRNVDQRQCGVYRPPARDPHYAGHDASGIQDRGTWSLSLSTLILYNTSLWMKRRDRTRVCLCDAGLPLLVGSVLTTCICLSIVLVNGMCVGVQSFLIYSFTTGIFLGILSQVNHYCEVRPLLCLLSLTAQWLRRHHFKWLTVDHTRLSSPLQVTVSRGAKSFLVRKWLMLCPLRTASTRHARTPAGPW
jgi:hypothetical protein